MDLVSPLNVTVAFTGPSETSSCHPSLFAQCVMGALLGEPEFPNPPRTSRRACLSVRISPRRTTTPRNLPVPKSAVLLGPVKERGPGSITKLLRSATEAFLSGCLNSSHQTASKQPFCWLDVLSKKWLRLLQ